MKRPKIIPTLLTEVNRDLVMCTLAVLATRRAHHIVRRRIRSGRPIIINGQPQNGPVLKVTGA